MGFRMICQEARRTSGSGPLSAVPPGAQAPSAHRRRFTRPPPPRLQPRCRPDGFGQGTASLIADVTGPSPAAPHDRASVCARAASSAAFGDQRAAAGPRRLAGEAGSGMTSAVECRGKRVAGGRDPSRLPAQGLPHQPRGRDKPIRTHPPGAVDRRSGRRDSSRLRAWERARPAAKQSVRTAE